MSAEIESKLPSWSVIPVNAVIAVSNKEAPYGVYVSAVTTAMAPRRSPASNPDIAYTYSIADRYNSDGGEEFSSTPLVIAGEN
ncbi:hypothetical protein HFX_2820 [Haloferax mediterranei ATCC 33500]|uniref:Uncharacterized protein n=1 Tax=Haloferax mediterranei (strain ATCC 33500 / DSM 1411 / JCM 8866 / NBRC 14739 / NCIMB 2177 / R-4) TaxID=523841 RepID=I3R8D3_HALMT|nr:hypothetical protein HFX_2820 [Haloferax mediterranei ATCC 33500]